MDATASSPRDYGKGQTLCLFSAGYFACSELDSAVGLVMTRLAGSTQLTRCRLSAKWKPLPVSMLVFRGLCVTGGRRSEAESEPQNVDLEVVCCVTRPRSSAQWQPLQVHHEVMGRPLSCNVKRKAGDRLELRETVRDGRKLVLHAPSFFFT